MFRWLNISARWSKRPVTNSFCSPTRLREVLQRERKRADRNGASFSLLTLSVPRQESVEQYLVLLESTLKERLRETDEAGLLEQRRVGVLLPDTPASGAWKLANDLCAMLPAHVVCPSCEVYEYRTMTRLDENRPMEVDACPNTSPSVQALETLLVQSLPPGKRFLDVVGATVGIILLAPVMFAAALAIKLTSPGPVFFAQRRNGLGGRPFTMYKCRTMCVGADAMKSELGPFSEQDGPAFKMSQDPRVTRVGRLLRRTSIDELPQLWNVLRGEMSLVGPRPLPCEESDACETWQRRRLDVTPGITSIWQVKGRSQVSFAEWVRMDLQYIRSRSLAQDLKLLVQTVPAVLRGRGAK